jgi:hypothetical protein
MNSLVSDLCVYLEVIITIFVLRGIRGRKKSTSPLRRGTFPS